MKVLSCFKNIQKKQGNRLFFAVIGLFLLQFGACSSRYYFHDTSNLPTHLAPPDPQKIKLERKLMAEEIQVIQEGQYILISIPSALLFLPHSPVLLWPSYHYLNDVACYIKMFRKVEVQVNAYDTMIESHQRSLSLTRLRATNVANYLSSQQIDSRLLLMQGLANDKPIMKTERPENRWANARIEILFKEEII
jgi:intracellular multiplication protein IcmN